MCNWVLSTRLSSISPGRNVVSLIDRGHLSDSGSMTYALTEGRMYLPCGVLLPFHEISLLCCLCFLCLHVRRLFVCCWLVGSFVRCLLLAYLLVVVGPSHPLVMLLYAHAPCISPSIPSIHLGLCICIIGGAFEATAASQTKQIDRCLYFLVSIDAHPTTQTTMQPIPTNLEMQLNKDHY